MGKDGLRRSERLGVCSAVGKFVKISKKIDGAMSGVLVALLVLGYNRLGDKEVNMSVKYRIKKLKNFYPLLDTVRTKRL